MVLNRPVNIQSSSRPQHFIQWGLSKGAFESPLDQGRTIETAAALRQAETANLRVPKASQSVAWATNQVVPLHEAKCSMTL